MKTCQSWLKLLYEGTFLQRRYQWDTRVMNELLSESRIIFCSRHKVITEYIQEQISRDFRHGKSAAMPANVIKRNWSGVPCEWLDLKLCTFFISSFVYEPESYTPSTCVYVQRCISPWQTKITIADVLIIIHGHKKYNYIFVYHVVWTI